MDKQMTISAFSDELAQVRTKKKEFLSQIERIVPWKEWLAMIQPCYYTGLMLTQRPPCGSGPSTTAFWKKPRKMQSGSLRSS